VCKKLNQSNNSVVVIWLEIPKLFDSYRETLGVILYLLEKETEIKAIHSEKWKCQRKIEGMIQKMKQHLVERRNYSKIISKKKEFAIVLEMKGQIG
jgi:hypothetical protein